MVFIPHTKLLAAAGVEGVIRFYQYGAHHGHFCFAVRPYKLKESICALTVDARGHTLVAGDCKGNVQVRHGSLHVYL